MAKKIVRLTEGQLHKVITESVQRILREMDEAEIAEFNAFVNEMLNDDDVYQKVFEIADNNDYSNFPVENFLDKNFDAIVEYYADKCDVYDKETLLRLLDAYDIEIYRDYVEPFAEDYFAEEHDQEDIANWQRAHYRDEGWY